MTPRPWHAVLTLSSRLMCTHPPSSPAPSGPPCLEQAPYAEWAHHHWVWISHAGNQTENLDMISDYLCVC